MNRSFAFQTQAPVAREVRLDGGTPRSGVAGGQTQGGVVNTTPQTDFGETQIPEFLAKAFEPQIQRRQEEMFLKGAMEAQTKQAIDDVAKKSPSWSRVFGPSAYEEGAADFYSSHVVVTDYFKSLNDRQAELLQKDPEQVRKEILDGIDGLMTQNPTANLYIRKGVMDNLGPFMEQYSKGRIAYQQQQAVTARDTAVDSASGLFDAAAKNFELLKDNPTEEDTAGYQTARSNFTSLFQSVGEDPKAYQDGLKRAGYGMLQRKEFRAFRAFKDSPFYQNMKTEDRQWLDDQSSHFEKLANNDAAVNYIPDMQLLKADIQKAKYFYSLPKDGQEAALKQGYKPLTDTEVLARKLAINHMISSDAGTTEPYYTAQQLESSSDDVMAIKYNAAIQDVNDQKAQRQQAANREAEFELKQREAQIEASAAKLAFQSGTLGQAGVDGVVKPDMQNMLIRQAFDAGDIKGLNANYGTGLSFSDLGNYAQQQIQASMGVGFTNNFASHLQKFQQMSTGLAMELYGPYYEKMAVANDFVQAGESPEVAYDRAFGQKVATAQKAFPTLRYKDADAVGKRIDDAVSKLGPNILGVGLPDFAGLGRAPNTSAKFAVTQATLDFLGTKIKGRAPTDKEIQAGIQGVMASGDVALYGKFGWRQRPGTQKLHEFVGVPKDVMDNVLYRYIDDDLTKKKFPGGANGNVTEVLWSQSGVEPHLLVVGFDEQSGKETYVPITGTQLKTYAQSIGLDSLKKAEKKAKTTDYLINGDAAAKADWHKYMSDTLYGK